MVNVADENGVRVWVNTKDHKPPHVHAETGSGEMLAYLGEKEMSGYEMLGNMTTSDMRKAEKVVNKNIEDCWRKWRKYHE